MSKAKDFLNKIIPTWKKDEQIRAENLELTKAVQELIYINRGLNSSVGELMRQNDGLKEEAVSLLSAIVCQHGGEFTIKSEFFSVLADPNNSNLRLKLEREEDKSVTLKLVPEQEEEDKEDE